ncbi:hypothetical protein H6F67_19980 [Microcoleus sp. FACHB-1515]|uniref:hypothetical protein n=1 Tax=Cyanophyceae TaxID=3028117 RepID=UPI0016824CFE|nr:hypothetical protein [Microcoleus sp. FACHB-1515]MBD2092132.1 hypothetical protein [Microcoleus sp. FACHB-1515]
MRTLTEAEYQIEAEPHLRKIFIHDDAFQQPFAFGISDRLIIFPYKYSIEPPLTEAIVAAAASLGEKNCYFSILWRWQDPQQTKAIEPSHWQISLTEFHAAYVGDENCLPLIASRQSSFNLLEGAIYSGRGTWGIMVTHESFGLLGGTSEFMQAVRSFMPNIDQQVLDFLSYIKECKQGYGKDGSFAWVRSLLTHVYGAENVNLLLLNSGLVQFKKKGIKFLN